MRLLFIKPKLIGDALLMSPALRAARAKYPAATIHVVCRSGSAEILDGCSEIDRVFATAAPSSDGRERRLAAELALIRELRREFYDWAFELSDTDRGRFLALAARANGRVMHSLTQDRRKRALFHCIWQLSFRQVEGITHQAVHSTYADWFLVNQVLDLGQQPASLSYRPCVFDPIRAGLAEVEPVLPANRLVIHGGTRLPSKAWPDARWVALLEAVADRFDAVFLSFGPSKREEDFAHRLTLVRPTKIFCPSFTLPWHQLASLLQGAKLFVGVDTAAMHLAVACGCPVVAIWGPSSAIRWGPCGPRDRVVIGGKIVSPPFSNSCGYSPDRQTTENSVEDVILAIQLLLSEQG
ncbi:MAG: glycosyltransferase family 9 protein [Verrucomicrobia bacterium]|nr:glycosyltransferase family 9 protein [Verrucomicrobiota bacterium]